jgi:hypothetical protein
MLGRLTVSLMKKSLATGAATAVSARARDAADRAKTAAVQAVPAGKRAGTTAVHGMRQGVQDARDWATPLVEDAVYGAREWAAPVLEDAADAVTGTVAPKVSSALRTTARRVRPPKVRRGGIRRLLDWRLLAGVGAAAAAAGAAAAVTMRRRYASATAEAKDATESQEGEHAGPSDPASEAAKGSEVNGRVASPGS